MATKKTPASILQEMCIRNGAPPQYDLIHDGGGSHEALFKYQVHVGNVSAVGSGRSKKEAKHDAARNILNKLMDNTPEPIVKEMAEVEVMSPYEDLLTENAVGGLQELCMTHEMPMPKYDLIADEGPAHAKQFTMKCRVNKLEESAIARTKKQAKQMAAHKMLVRLKKCLGDMLEVNVADQKDSANKDYPDSNVNAAAAKYKEVGTLNTRSRIPVGQKISEYHLMLRHLKSDVLDKFKEQDAETMIQAENDPEDLLKTLLKELDVECEYEEVQSSKEAHMIFSSGHRVILLSITTTPEAVLFGEGRSIEEANTKAAVKALQYLKLMNM